MNLDKLIKARKVQITTENEMFILNSPDLIETDFKNIYALFVVGDQTFTLKENLLIRECGDIRGIFKIKSTLYID